MLQWKKKVLSVQLTETYTDVWLLLTAVRSLIARSPQAEAFSRPTAQPVTTPQFLLYLYVLVHGRGMVSSLCPVAFRMLTSLTAPANTGGPFSPTHVGLEPVDQWSRVPTSTVPNRQHSSLHICMACNFDFSSSLSLVSLFVINLMLPQSNSQPTQLV